MWKYNKIPSSDELCHHGILGQKWGVRRYQNPDGSLTPEGKKRYLKSDAGRFSDKGQRLLIKDAERTLKESNGVRYGVNGAIKKMQERLVENFSDTLRMEISAIEDEYNKYNDYDGSMPGIVGRTIALRKEYEESDEYRKIENEAIDEAIERLKRVFPERYEGRTRKDLVSEDGTKMDLELAEILPSYLDDKAAEGLERYAKDKHGVDYFALNNYARNITELMEENILKYANKSNPAYYVAETAISLALEDAYK